MQDEPAADEAPAYAEEEQPSETPAYAEEEQPAPDAAYEPAPEEAPPDAIADEQAAAPSSRYLIVDKIGAGGAGAVYRAWDQDLRRYVALKRLKGDAAIESEIRREAEYLATLQHPNIISIFDFGSDADGTYVVMELVSGQTLEDYAEGHKATLPFFFELADQLCRGLGAAHHAGLVHQDFKPGNVMLHWHDDKTFTAKILDFGLAKVVKDNQTVQEGSVVGSVYTIAPEQLRQAPVDTRTDIYSLGTVFYFTLLGKYPYEAKTVQEIVHMHLNSTPKPLHLFRHDLPRAASDEIMKMMARDPGARPQTVQEIRAALQVAAKPKPVVLSVSRSGAPIPAPGAQTFGRPKPQPPWVLIIIIVAALAGGAGWWLTTQHGDKGGATGEPADATPTPALAPAFPKLDPLDEAAVAKSKNLDVTVEGMVVGYEKSELIHAWKLKFSAAEDSRALVLALADDKFAESQAQAFVNKRVRVSGTVTSALGTMRIKIDDPAKIKTL